MRKTATAIPSGWKPSLVGKLQEIIWHYCTRPQPALPVCLMKLSDSLTDVLLQKAWAWGEGEMEWLWFLSTRFRRVVEYTELLSTQLPSLWHLAERLRAISPVDVRRRVRLDRKLARQNLRLGSRQVFQKRFDLTRAAELFCYVVTEGTYRLWWVESAESLLVCAVHA